MLRSFMQIPGYKHDALTPHQLCEFWATVGSSVAPVLKHVARSVLGVPASSAVLERDFCIASQSISAGRGVLDPAYAEMLLFLRASYDIIPKSIRSLDGSRVENAIPRRLRDSAQLQEVEHLYPPVPRRGQDVDLIPVPSDDEEEEGQAATKF